ncbi:response regulator [Pinibacter aurantiacus]|uniref:Response regulator n=1 Tax=Pinibacter aurantiacus TaxID=2851599 RepID=A0A9E2S983_9BACT|nr:response regulator [Pinibacter aurantiacus]MBV4358701.1 response regulator [Pinibacter aurantiacus]
MATPTTSTIFIADDDMEDLSLLEEAIMNHNPYLVIQTFRNSNELLHALTLQYPSLIVLDYNMPPTTGPEVLSLLKNNPNLRNIPKIIWSCSSNADHIRACFSEGAVAYFIKPFSLAEYGNLAKEICAHLKSRNLISDTSDDLYFE